MKNSIIIILIACLISSLTLNFVILARNNKPTEILGEEGIIQSITQESSNIYKYEIITEDGNIWETYGTGCETIGDNLIVIFNTFNSNNYKNWEIISFWKITDRE